MESSGWSNGPIESEETKEILGQICMDFRGGKGEVEILEGRSGEERGEEIQEGRRSEEDLYRCIRGRGVGSCVCGGENWEGRGSMDWGRKEVAHKQERAVGSDEVDRERGDGGVGVEGGRKVGVVDQQYSGMCRREEGE